MRKSLKQVLSPGLAVALILGVLSGCTATDYPTPTPTPTSSPTTADTNGTTRAQNSKSTATPSIKPTAKSSANPVAKSGQENWKKFDKAVNITIPVYDRSKVGYPAVDNNYWTQWVQRNFGDAWNINVEYVAIPYSDAMSEYSLLMAAGDTPTILMDYDHSKAAQWASDSVLQAIDLDEFKEVAPTYYKSMADNNLLGYTDINGETFFVLTERSDFSTPYSFATFIRLDWLEAVGLKIPESYEEEVAAIDAIIAAGLADQAPLGLPGSVDSCVNNFAFRDYPPDEAEWVMYSGSTVPALPWYPTEKLLKRQNAEYNAGWYSSEYDIGSGDLADGGMSRMQTDFINGKTYRYSGYISSKVDWLEAFYDNNPDAKLAVECQYRIEEPGVVDNAQIHVGNPFGMVVGFNSLASKDQLKAAWMLMEWMIQPDTLFTLENGIEGLTYTMGKNGLPVVDMEYRGVEMLNHDMNIDMTSLVHTGKKLGTIEETIASISPKGLPQDFTQELIDNYYELKEIADRGHAYSDPVFTVAIESESEFSEELQRLYKEYSVALIKCAPEDFDSLYAELSKNFLDAGYQDIIDERLAAYEAGNTTKLPK